MNEWGYFKLILKKSVEKNGEQPLTNKWLLNIIKLIELKINEDDFRFDVEGCDIY